MIGNRRRLTSPRLVNLAISWHGPLRFSLGAIRNNGRNCRAFCNMSPNDRGGVGLISAAMRLAMESNPPRTGSHPSAISIRRYDPKTLIASGKSHLAMFSKSSALPPRSAWPGSICIAAVLMDGARLLLCRSAISVTSRIGETSDRTRCSSPDRSNTVRKSRRQEYMPTRIWQLPTLCHSRG